MSLTIETMSTAGVAVGLVAAWWGPQGALIDNDEVASFVRACPDRLIGVASVISLARYPAEFAEFMRNRGAKKVMFGTNYPMLTASACLEGMESLGLGADAKEAFLSGNARRVFKLDDAG